MERMSIKEVISRVGGQTALHRLTGIPLRTVQNWAVGNRQPTSYMEWLLSEWYTNRFDIATLKSENEHLRRDVEGLADENEELRQTIATLCRRQTK